LAAKSKPPAVRVVVDSGAGIITILANSTMVLVQLEMTRVQFVFEKVVSIAYATIPPQVEGLHIFCFALQHLLSLII